eukprot:2760288-Amphidinium_carterae.2
MAHTTTRMTMGVATTTVAPAMIDTPHQLAAHGNATVGEDIQRSEQHLAHEEHSRRSEWVGPRSRTVILPSKMSVLGMQ